MKQNVRMVIVLVTLILLNMVSTITFTGADDETDTEVGIWWEKNLSTPIELPYADEEARSFSETLVDDGWTEEYDRGDGQSLEAHWVNSTHGGSDNSWVDDCDFVYFVGHGGPAEFLVHYDFIPWDYTLVEADECTWGDDDLEWFFTPACELLHQDHISEWDDVFEGLHGICGFQTESYWDETYRLGNCTANYLISQKCIGDSWKEATQWFHEIIDEDDVIGASYSAKINRPGYSPFDYYYESTDGMWPDYGSGGITLASLEYEYWDC